MILFKVTRHAMENFVHVLSDKIADTMYQVLSGEEGFVDLEGNDERISRHFHDYSKARSYKESNQYYQSTPLTSTRKESPNDSPSSSPGTRKPFLTQTRFPKNNDSSNLRTFHDQDQSRGETDLFETTLVEKDTYGNQSLWWKPVDGDERLSFETLQTEKFDELVSRHCNDFERGRTWWSPSWIRQTKDMGSPSMDHSLYSQTEYTDSINSDDELYARINCLSSEKRRRLLQLLHGDFDGAQGTNALDNSTQEFNEHDEWIALQLIKLNTLVHIWIRLCILLFKQALPHIKSLYYKFHQNQLHLFNQKNAGRLLDVILVLMQGLEKILISDTNQTLWHVFSKLVANTSFNAKQKVLSVMLAKSSKGDGRINQIRRAAVEWAVKTYLDSSNVVDTGTISREREMSTSIETTANWNEKPPSKLNEPGIHSLETLLNSPVVQDQEDDQVKEILNKIMNRIKEGTI